jgi:membrane dipeptidase
MRIDRRNFLSTMGAAAALPVLGAASRAQRSTDTLIVNALGGLDDPNLWDDATAGGSGPASKRREPLSRRVIADARASGMNAVNVTLGYVSGLTEPFEATVDDIALWDWRIRHHGQDLLKVLAAEDLLRARRENRIGVIYGVQNAAMLGDKPERVDLFADLGLRVVQLTYNPSNTLGDGATAPLNRGLTPFGRAVVERLNGNGIMVDLSHSGERTCLEAARISRRPISINHTGCRALNDVPRNKTDAELRLVASRGGFVGIYFMPFLVPSSVAHAEDVVAHIVHAVNVCGEDHVGIGTDGGTTGIDDMPAYRAHMAKQILERRKAGIGAPGENADTLPLVIDLQGPAQFHRLEGLLRRSGYKDARIEKIMGLNFLAYAREIWTA